MGSLKGRGEWGVENLCGDDDARHYRQRRCKYYVRGLILNPEDNPC